MHLWVFQKAEIARAASVSAISAFWQTHKCKLIPNWTTKTIWLLINNINMKKFARRKCRKISLRKGSEHLTRIWHFIYWLADEDQLITLRTQSGSFKNICTWYRRKKNRRCVICTGVTLFALVLHLNCTALSQSESSNFFMYVIIKVIWPVRHDEFLNLQLHILEFVGTENHQKHGFLAVGWCGCRLSLNVKKLGEGMGAVKNSCYFLACNAIEMLKIARRPICSGTKGSTYLRSGEECEQEMLFLC